MKKCLAFGSLLLISHFGLSQVYEHPTTHDIGIGTESPAAKLHVESADGGKVLIGGSTGQSGAISLNGTFTDYNIISSVLDKNLYLNRPAGRDMLFRHGGFDQMTLKANGNLGIRNINPQALLEIAHDGGSTFGTIIQVKTTAGVDGPRLAFEKFVPNTSTTTTPTPPKRWNVGIRQGGTSFGFFEDGYSSSFGTERFTILPGGNVGIGTTTPNAKFHLHTAGTVAYTGDANNHDALYIGPNKTGTTGNIAVFTSDPGTQDFGGTITLGGKIDVNNELATYAKIKAGKTITSSGFDYSGYLSFYTRLTGTAPAERLRIDHLGNVGIGTTTPIFSPNTTKFLAVDGGSGFSEIGSGGNVSSTTGFLGVIAFYNRNITAAEKRNAAIISRNDGAVNKGTLEFSTADGNGLKERMRISSAGIVGIGTTTALQANADPYKLYVAGGIRTIKVKVDLTTNWPDYVFNPSYELRSLSTLEDFIKTNNHLPDLPSAEEVEKSGIDLGDSQAALLRKIEELTLYVIQQNKKQEEMSKKIELQQEQIKIQQDALLKLKAEM